MSWQGVLISTWISLGFVLLMLMDKTLASQKVYSIKPDESTKVIKHCEGTSFGRSVKGLLTSHYKFYSRFYQNCTVIQGNLELTHIQSEDIHELDFYNETLPNGTVVQHNKQPFWFLKDVEEITGYLLIFFVNTKKIELPKLRVVRGKNLYDGAAITISATSIEQLVMPNFRAVLKGNISLTRKNNQLCYFAKSILHSEFFENYSTQKLLDGVTNETCPSFLKCHSFCGGNHCYGPGPDECQQLYRQNCPGCDTCFEKTLPDNSTTKHCCDSECAGSCTDTGPKNCIACKNYRQDDTCVPECNGINVYNKRTLSLVRRPKNKIRYYYDDFCVKACPPTTLIKGKYCVVSCQKGYFRNIDVDSQKCIRCKNGVCPKVCTVEEFLTTDILRNLKNCTEINGSIQILAHLFSEKHFSLSLLDNLRSVKIVNGHVLIQGGHNVQPEMLQSLSFLENLRIIDGRELALNSALYIQGLPELTELGLKNLARIGAGRVVILHNPKLCFGDSIKLTNMTDFKGLLSLIRSNVSSDFCAKYNFICDESCEPRCQLLGSLPNLQCLQGQQNRCSYL